MNEILQTWQLLLAILSGLPLFSDRGPRRFGNRQRTDASFSESSTRIGRDLVFGNTPTRIRRAVFGSAELIYLARIVSRCQTVKDNQPVAWVARRFCGYNRWFVRRQTR